MRFRHGFLGDVLDAALALDLVFQLLDCPLEQLFRIDPGEAPINFASARAVAATESETFSGFVVSARNAPSEG
jgi:hypothetical protein